MTASLSPAYRYVTLPDRIDLSTPTNSSQYATATVTIPGIGSTKQKPSISIPGSRVAWGLTIPKSRGLPGSAISFVQLLLGATGSKALAATGPTPVIPARVRPADYDQLPAALRSLVAAGELPP